jgi:hypothetical protein
MLRPVLVGVVAVLLLAASPALAGTREQILQQCQEGRLTGDFTVQELRAARNNIPTDIDQYSDCRDVLARALAAKAGGGGGTGPGGGGGGNSPGGESGGTLTPTTAEDTKALEQAAGAGDAPVEVGGEQLVPGAAGLDADAPRSALPAGMIVVLALLALAAATGAAPLVRRRLGGLGGLATLGRRALARGR